MKQQTQIRDKNINILRVFLVYFVKLVFAKTLDRINVLH